MGKNFYPHLLEPLKVRNFTLKNRMESASSMLHHVQGPEEFPAESLMTNFVNRAKNGAAIVTISGLNDQPGEANFPPESDMARFPHFDVYNPRCQNYFVMLTEAIHYYDSLACIGIFCTNKVFPYKKPDGTMELISAAGDGPVKKDAVGFDVFGKATIEDDVSAETLEKVADSIAQQAVLVKSLGFDMVTLHMSYRGQICGQFLSPLTNHRTDDFNGDINHRGKFPAMVCRRIREAVGNDFLIEVTISGEEPEGGNTIDDTIAFIKMIEDDIDFVQIRTGNGDNCSTTPFCLDRVPFLDLAEKVKKSGTKVKVGCSGGWLDPEAADNALAEGKVDFISMARAWISNPEYGAILRDGRKEDIVPCLRCNKCHGRGPSAIYASVCSVNPTIGIEHLTNIFEQEPGPSKNIAVIGGGPGGMRTAIFLSKRGHKVSIFEKEDTLGGLIRHSDMIDFKWTLKDYKDYLISTVERDENITVFLNTEVSPDMIGDDFDVVIAAVGSSPVRPPIPGADGNNVCFAVDAIMESEKTGDKVVVIGGGEVGVETGMYLAQQGKEVTVLEMRSELAADSTLIHYRALFKEAWESLEHFHSEVNARATKITEHGVTYLDAEGNEKELEADTVVLSAGMRANTDEALAFYNTAQQFFMVGDCKKAGTIQSVNRSAYAVASQI
ncbi:MAG: FAD-dependent oxidoreductase [Agathobacter sp.]